MGPTRGTADGGKGRLSGAGSAAGLLDMGAPKWPPIPQRFGAPRQKPWRSSYLLRRLAAGLADSRSQWGARGGAGLEIRHAEERAARLRGGGLAGHAQRAGGRAERDEDVQHAAVAHAL